MLLLAINAWYRTMSKCYQIENIASQTDKSCNQHDISFNVFDFVALLREFLWYCVTDYSVCCFPSQPNDHCPNNHNTCKCANNFSSMISKGFYQCWSFLTYLDRKHTNYKSTNVRTHMRSICENSKRSTQNSTYDFNDHENKANYDNHE